MSIRIGILGYGNLGRGVEYATEACADMELAAVFTRRNPSSLNIRRNDVPVVSVNDIETWKDKIDVLILCGGKDGRQGSGYFRGLGSGAFFIEPRLCQRDFA